MSQDKTLRLQRLILFVLVLNLVCLAVLVFRKAASPVVLRETERTVERVPFTITPPASHAELPEPVAPLRPRQWETNSRSPDVASTVPSASPARASESPGSSGLVPVPVPVWASRISSATTWTHADRPDLLTIGGMVKLSGTPPPERDIPVGATCGPNPKPLQTRFYVTSADGGLADVFVWVANPPAALASLADKTVTLDQIDCQYQPYVFALQVGQQLRIRNSDPFLHNVNTSGSAHHENRFNIAQTSRGMETIKTFSGPELPLKFRCNVHPWMIAYAGVFDHPWFAVTGTNGHFSIRAELPPGRYQLMARHMKAGLVTQEYDLRDTRNGVHVGILFTLHVPSEGEGLTQR